MATTVLSHSAPSFTTSFYFVSPRKAQAKFDSETKDMKHLHDDSSQMSPSLTLRDGGVPGFQSGVFRNTHSDACLSNQVTRSDEDGISYENGNDSHHTRQTGKNNRQEKHP